VITVSEEKLVVGISNEIGEYVARATRLLQLHGWHRTCHLLRDSSDIHKDVKHLKHRAAPIIVFKLAQAQQPRGDFGENGKGSQSSWI
jgi:hypothetical protein